MIVDTCADYQSAERQLVQPYTFIVATFGWRNTTACSSCILPEMHNQTAARSLTRMNGMSGLPAKRNAQASFMRRAIAYL